MILQFQYIFVGERVRVRELQRNFLIEYVVVGVFKRKIIGVARFRQFIQYGFGNFTGFEVGDAQDVNVVTFRRRGLGYDSVIIVYDVFVVLCGGCAVFIRFTKRKKAVN